MPPSVKAETVAPLAPTPEAEMSSVPEEPTMTPVIPVEDEVILLTECLSSKFNQISKGLPLNRGGFLCSFCNRGLAKLAIFWRPRPDSSTGNHGFSNRRLDRLAHVA